MTILRLARFKMWRSGASGDSGCRGRGLVVLTISGNCDRIISARGVADGNRQVKVLRTPFSLVLVLRAGSV
jgi:hypothetical protein